MNSWQPIFFAILAGIFTTLEATINSKLGRIVTPKIATLHSLITGVVMILLVNLIKGSVSEYSKIIFVSPKYLIGGIFGTCIVYLVIRTIPILGITVTLTLIVSSQLISGLFMDTLTKSDYGLEWEKILGICMLLVGTYFIIK